MPAIKVQSPFFERFGVPGLRAMAELADGCRALGTLVIHDAKRGDAEDTAPAYADLYLGADSQLRGDAVTAVPFMGFASLVPLCEMADGLADDVNAFNLAHAQDGGVGPVAALVGAPAAEAKRLLGKLTCGLVSMPGLGRPGRTVAEFAATVGPAGPRVLLPVTSGLLRAGPLGLADEIVRWQADLRSHHIAVRP